jgi:23S rRNA (pseudouridine1915-N3)-methyltransferase
MKFRLVWVGRTRERYLAEGIRRYEHLLGTVARVSIVEVPEVRGRSRDKIVEEEGRRILRLGEPYVLFDEKGRVVSSREFAAFIESCAARTFVIGGAFGVSQEVRQRALESVALSRMTFTHEMARLIALEQFYRAMTILKGKEYHH